MGRPFCGYAQLMRLGAVAYIVPDYDAGIAFFTALGWTLAEDIDQGRKRWVTVTDGHLRLVLARAEGQTQKAAIGAQFAGRVGLFMMSRDFATDAARIRAAGGVFEEEPRRESYGTVAVWRDPWGTRWDLIEPAEPTD
ncbi:VOC family protein [Jannaschia sp. M317]|uniref:VOC family protein n=1 Tax=Jannaschia sp. M317 TaxID=2867011 RepID=UPI0038FCEB76